MTSPINSNGAQHLKNTSFKFSFLAFFLSIFFAQATFAQNCTATDGCIDFAFDSKVDNADGTSTYCFTLTNPCKKALSHVAFSVPQAATSPADNSTYQSPGGKNYHIENTTNNPFLSIKYETIGEGIKKGGSDMFCFDLPTALDYNTFTIEAKAANKRYRVTMDLNPCLETGPDCSDLPYLDGGEIAVADFDSGKPTQKTAGPAGTEFVIFDENSPKGGADELEIFWVKCESGNCEENDGALKNIDMYQLYEDYLANSNASNIDGTCWSFFEDGDTDDLSLTMNDGVDTTTCFIRYVRSAGCEDFARTSVVKITAFGGIEYFDSNDDLVEKNDFKTYPNPASDQISILVDLRFAGKKGRLMISDQFGKQLIQTTIEIENGIPLKLNTSALQMGIYNIHIIFDEGKNSLVKKLLIRK